MSVAIIDGLVGQGGVRLTNSVFSSGLKRIAVCTAGHDHLLVPQEEKANGHGNIAENAEKCIDSCPLRLEQIEEFVQNKRDQDV